MMEPPWIGGARDNCGRLRVASFASRRARLLRLRRVRGGSGVVLEERAEACVLLVACLTPLETGAHTWNQLVRAGLVVLVFELDVAVELLGGGVLVDAVVSPISMSASPASRRGCSNSSRVRAPAMQHA
jgi:hypothetical protein